MEIVRNIILGLYIVVCICLIIVTMVQNKDNSNEATTSDDLANNFYEKNKGRTKSGKMQRLTIILSIIFAVLAIVLGILVVM